LHKRVTQIIGTVFFNLQFRNYPICKKKAAVARSLEAGIF